MAIKVTLGAPENTQKEKPFPKLMKSKVDGAIVLFYKKRCGAYILKFNHFTEFGYHEDFNMFNFEDILDPVTLQND